jgi:DNA polymerase-3 subunit beta
MKKLIISSDALKTALGKLSQAVDPKSILPVLKNLYCKVTAGQLQLTGSDTEITIVYKVECEAKEEFEFLLPYEFTSKIVALNKHCPLEIEVGKKVLLKGPNDAYELKVAEKLKDFPQVPEVPHLDSVEVMGDVIRCLHTALDTTGKVDNKPQLAFVLMELSPGKITVASTDGAYMVFSKEFEYDHQLTQELLLSQKVIKSLPASGLQVLKIFYTEKAIRFESDNLTIINTRSEEKFVNFRKVFPEEWPANLNVNRYDLIQALVRCSLTDDQLHATKLNLVAEEVKLAADDHMLQVNVAVPVAYSGTVTNAVINSEKLLKLLNQIEHDELTMAIHDSSRAIVLSTKDDAGYKGMIMPIASQN